MKIEPMSFEEIRDIVGCYHMGDQKWGIGSSTAQDLERMIMAWAHERAEKLEAEEEASCPWPTHLGKAQHCRHKLRAEHLNEVLDLINWPKEQR